MAMFGPDDLVALRRDIHRFAETAFLEIRTAALVIEHVRPLDVTVRWGASAMSWDAVVDAPPLDARQSAAERAVAAGAPAELARHLAEHGTAVVVDIDGGRPGPRWAVRVDMDGLPIAESTDADHPPARLGFRSVTGAMHACAHDAHTAIGVGLAHRLAGTEFPGSLRLLFQPAEEGARGAHAMLGRGVVDGIDRFVGVHLGEDQPVGRVVGGAHGLLATEKLRVRFTGRPAHSGLSPERGRNALAAAAQATLGLLGMPRHGGALTRVNVGRLTAGDAINVVPGWAELMCETRSDDPEVARDLGRRARAIVAGAATMYDVAAEVSVLGAATTFPPDPALVDLVMEAARRRGVTDAVEHCTVSASDDASLFAEVVREHGGLASFVVVGGGNTAPHHHPAFDIDEAALPVALDLLESLVRG